MLNERDLRHPLAGGVEVHQEEIARRLAEQHGIETTVLCSSFDGAKPEEWRDGVRYVRFGDRQFSYYAQLPGRARAEVRARPYDLVVENLCKILFFSPLYVPGIPRLALVHHLFGLSAFRQVAPLRAAYVVATEILLPVMYRSWPVIAVSPSTREDLVRRGLSRDRITVIPNGLDHDQYAPSDCPADPGLVVFVGRLEYYKGVDVLLDSWPEVLAASPGARLVLVGAGTADASLRQRVREEGLEDSVSFEGFVDEATKIAWMQRATVVVQPSHKEGWGLTVPEANACGTPVVATDVPGLRDSVRHDETGLLVRAADASSLAEGVARVLSEPELRARLGAGARLWARRFGWDDVTSAFAAVVRAVAERREPPPVPDFLAPAVSRDGA